MEYSGLKSQYKSIKQEIDQAIKKVLEHSIFIGGKEVEEFEKEIAEFCGREYGISVNSGTDALYLSLKALGVGPGHEVITSPFSFISPAEVIANLGAKPVFVDISANTFNINSSKIEEKITQQTKAIIPIHLFGQMAEMSEINEIAKKHKLAVVEDAAQAAGAEIEAKKAGSFGHLGCFSFFPSKNLGAFGDGGMIVTNNKELADKIRLFKNHGSCPKEKYLNLVLGSNSRLDALQAAILRVKLKYLEQWNKKRAENAQYYNSRLNNIAGLVVPFCAPNRKYVFHQYTIRANKRDELRNYLKEKDIPTMVYYPLSLHLQPCFKYLGHKEGDFPEAERASQQVLSLPIYPELSKQDQEYIIKEIKNFYEKQV